MLFKDKKRKLLAGLDLGDQYTQISFIYTDRDEPVTVSAIAGQEQYNVPTVLCKRREVNQWFYGKEAQKRAKEDGNILVGDLLESARKGEEVVIDGQAFAPVDLLALFVRRVISMLNSMVNCDKPDGLMITVDRLDNRMIEILSLLVPRIGMNQGDVYFQSHTESFFQFVIHQPDNLWTHQVVVCDYSNHAMTCYRMDTNRRTTPVVAFIEEKEYSSMPYEKIPAEEPFKTKACLRLDERFTSVVNDICKEGMITTCYLIGDGFLGNWCKESLKTLCRNRRVFQGNNLYSKGACYSIAEKYAPSELNGKYIYLGKDKVKANIGMHAFDHGDNIYYPVMDAGINWYDANREWDVLLDREDKIHLMITPLNRKEKKEIIFTLDHIPDRKEAFSRIHMGIKFTAVNQFTVYAEDMGFGEFFPSEGRTWKEEVSWEE